MIPGARHLVMEDVDICVSSLETFSFQVLYSWFFLSQLKGKWQWFSKCLQNTAERLWGLDSLSLRSSQAVGFAVLLSQPPVTFFTSVLSMEMSPSSSSYRLFFFSNLIGVCQFCLFKDSALRWPFMFSFYFYSSHLYFAIYDLSLSANLNLFFFAQCSELKS